MYYAQFIETLTSNYINFNYQYDGIEEKQSELANANATTYDCYG